MFYLGIFAISTDSIFNNIFRAIPLVNMNNSNNTKNFMDIISKNIFVVGIIILTITLLIVFGVEQSNNKSRVKGDVVNEFYSATLKPLFTSESIDKKDVLNFALEGDLLLDKKENKVLQLSKDSVGREVLAIKRFDNKEFADSYKLVVKRLQLEEGKRKEKLDSILDLYSKELSKLIYKDKNEVLAVDPQIGTIQKLLNKDLSDFLKDKSPAENSLNRIAKRREHKASRDYFVFTPDTVFQKEYQVFIPENSKIKEPEKIFIHTKNKSKPSSTSMDEGRELDFQIDSNFVNVTLDYFQNSDEFENIHLFKTFIDSTNDKMNFSFALSEDSSDNVKFKFSYSDSAKNKIKYEMSSDEIEEAIENSIKIFSGKDVDEWIEFGNKMDSLSQKKNNKIEKEK